MGRQKDEEMDKDMKWEQVARAKGLGCKVCGLANPQRGETWVDDLCPEHHPDNHHD
jgi:hypothetical protein